MWIIERGSRFKTQFKKLNPKLQEKTTDIIQELCSQEDPSKICEYKKSMKVYACKIDKSNRIILDFDFSNKIISFIRVGDHKSAYGKD